MNTSMNTVRIFARRSAITLAVLAIGLAAQARAAAEPQQAAKASTAVEAEYAPAPGDSQEQPQTFFQQHPVVTTSLAAMAVAAPAMGLIVVGQQTENLGVQSAGFLAGMAAISAMPVVVGLVGVAVDQDKPSMIAAGANTLLGVGGLGALAGLAGYFVVSNTVLKPASSGDIFVPMMGSAIAGAAVASVAMQHVSTNVLRLVLDKEQDVE